MLVIANSVGFNIVVWHSTETTLNVAVLIFVKCFVNKEAWDVTHAPVGTGSLYKL